MKIQIRNTFLRVLVVFLPFLPCQTFAHADYADRTDVSAFIEEIAARNQLDTASIRAALFRASHNPRVIELIKPPATRGVRSWRRYRSRFIDRIHLDAGLQAWTQYEHLLRRAEKEYGIPPEIILGILGVETIYGRNTGNFETLSALATLAFDYPLRAELFRGELEALFLLAHEQKRHPASYVGSYAGALGWPQFLPSSMRRYAVDFDGDGQIDFDRDGNDAIGSIANYLREYGWVAGAPIAVKARLAPHADPAPLVEAGVEPSLSPAQLAEAGIHPLTSAPSAGEATLIDLETPGEDTEYWLGYRNFYVITRYNRSNFYAMAVFQLANALRESRGGAFAPESRATAHKPAKAKPRKPTKAKPHAKPRKPAKAKPRAKPRKPVQTRKTRR
ncbi:MAG: lytic murein transglycosylase B [Azoarcus sp.]|jgi:membrane-bound lytic murein transglycosylase B|nr:lytic murein transglycosylase B [Azoarcus sp.]